MIFKEKLYFPLKDSDGDCHLFEYIDNEIIELDVSTTSPYNLGQVFRWVNYHNQGESNVDFRKPDIDDEKFQEFLQGFSHDEIKLFFAGTKTLQGPYHL